MHFETSACMPLQAGMGAPNYCLEIPSKQGARQRQTANGSPDWVDWGTWDTYTRGTLPEVTQEADALRAKGVRFRLRRIDREAPFRWEGEPTCGDSIPTQNGCAQEEP
jgi:hypothetical protein